MFRWIFALMGFMPVGWCRPDTQNRFWRNRRGGTVVFLGDVTENIGDAALLTVFRTPKDAWVIRDKYGSITGTITKKRRANADKPDQKDREANNGDQK